MPTLQTPILDCIDTELQRLAQKPLTIDGGEIGGLPNRQINVAELRSMLLHPSTDFGTRDAVLRYLADLNRHDDCWKSVLIAMVVPALRRVVTSLARTCDAVAVDLEAEVVAGAMGATATITNDSKQIASSIRWAGYRAGLRAINAAGESGCSSGTDHEGCPPSPPWGHPDLILNRAVAEGVITDAESELIGSTRLGDQSVTEAARQHKSTYQVTQRRRHRAEVRLVEWLSTQ
jgi:hypothetical protein